MARYDQRALKRRLQALQRKGYRLKTAAMTRSTGPRLCIRRVSKSPHRGHTWAAGGVCIADSIAWRHLWTAMLGIGGLLVAAMQWEGVSPPGPKSSLPSKSHGDGGASLKNARPWPWMQVDLAVVLK